MSFRNIAGDDEHIEEEWCSRGVHFSLVRSEMGELGDGLSAMEGGISGTSYTRKPIRLCMYILQWRSVYSEFHMHKTYNYYYNGRRVILSRLYTHHTGLVVVMYSRCP